MDANPHYKECWNFPGPECLCDGIRAAATRVEEEQKEYRQMTMPFFTPVNPPAWGEQPDFPPHTETCQWFLRGGACTCGRGVYDERPSEKVDRIEHLQQQLAAERRKRGGMQKRLDTLQSIVELHLPRIDGNAEEAQRLVYLVDQALAKQVSAWADEYRKLQDRIASLEAVVEVLATNDIQEPVDSGGQLFTKEMIEKIKSPPESGDPAKYGDPLDVPEDYRSMYLNQQRRISWLENARLPDWVIEKLDQAKLHDEARTGVHPVSKGPGPEERSHYFRGQVREVGGGVVDIVVDRDTMEYPPVGTPVIVEYWKKP